MIPNPNPECMVFTHRRPLAFPSTVFEETGSQQGHWQRTKRVLLSSWWATSCFSSVPAPGSLYSAAKVSEESYRTQLESVGSVCSLGRAKLTSLSRGSLIPEPDCALALSADRACLASPGLLPTASVQPNSQSSHTIWRLPRKPSLLSWLQRLSCSLNLPLFIAW